MTIFKVESLASRGGLLYRQAGYPEAAAQMLVRRVEGIDSCSDLFAKKNMGRYVPYNITNNFWRNIFLI